MLDQTAVPISMLLVFAPTPPALGKCEGGWRRAK